MFNLKSWPVIAGISSLVLLVAGVSFYFYEVKNFAIDSISADEKVLLNSEEHNSEGIVLSSNTLNLKVSYHGISSSPIVFNIDGQDIPLKTSLFSTSSRAVTPKLADGKHVLSVSAKDYDERWLITVDTKPPEVKISHPLPGYKSNKQKITLQGITEPGVTVKASSVDKTETCQANDKGYFTLTLPTQMGKCVINWEAQDKAGNVTKGQSEFLCDFTPPELNLSILQPAFKDKDGKEHAQRTIDPKSPYSILSSSTLTLKVETQDQESGIGKIDIFIDGKLQESIDCTSKQEETLTPQLDESTEEGNISESAPSPEPSSTPIALDTKPVTYNYNLPVLYEGTHTVSVLVQDGFGLCTRRNITFGLNTTEVYGQAPLGLGAVGDDVKELQRLLALRGYLKGDYTQGKYDKATQEAVIKLQEELYMAQDGIAGVLVTGALKARIYVNLSRFSAILVDEGEGLHHYSICTGVEEHPTPTGMYYISDMVKNPSWLPPNSEWAKDAKQAPPGPDNPLGTRWIGLGNAIGFHGTPYPGTVGTRASHGCMRMRMDEVEDLYERVNVGTQVQIFNGDEDNPIIKRYWP
ncbi:murein L,D-transpeptidase [bacterium]|nr:murein L,D-transpeptidase [bacterium]